MRNTLVILGLLLAITHFSACSEDPEQEITTIDAPPLGDTLQPERVSFEETTLWFPHDIKIVDDEYLIVIDGGGDEIFKVFSIPDLEFLYAWGPRGEGPEEMDYLPTAHTINIEGERLVIATSPSPELSSLEYYTVTDTALVLTDTKPMSYRDQRNPFNNVQRINDTLYFADYGYDGEDPYEHIALSPNNEEPLFKFGSFPESTLEGRERYSHYRKRNTSNPDGSRFIAFYVYHNKVNVYNPNGTLLNEVQIHDEYIDGETTEKNPFVFRGMSTPTENYIFVRALYQSRDELENVDPEDIRPWIEIWDWEGELQKRVNTGLSAGRYGVSLKHNALYTNERGNTNEFLIYGLSDILP